MFQSKFRTKDFSVEISRNSYRKACNYNMVNIDYNIMNDRSHFSIKIWDSNLRGFIAGTESY